MYNKRYLIVGLGLIGGSYARGLHALGHTVWAIDTNADSIQYALERGWIDKGSCKNDPDLIGEADVIISGLYPHTCVAWVLAHQDMMKPHVLITDVTGVKSGIVETIQENLREDVEFLASHPMAGKESSGVKNADHNIFKGANFIITPTEKNSKEAIAFLEDFAKSFQFGNIVSLTPQEHDHIVGYVSQLTHTIAISLMNATDSIHFKQYTGDSFRDLTRIAKINEVMWTELFLANKKQLVEEIDTFMVELNRLKQAIIEDDVQTIKDKMIQSTKRRTYLD